MCRKLEPFVLMLCHQVWTSSRILFPGEIFMTQKVSPFNSTLLVQLQVGLKGYDAFKYVAICPNFDLKEHYIHRAHWKYFWDASNFYLNINPFMSKNFSLCWVNDVHLSYTLKFSPVTSIEKLTQYQWHSPLSDKLIGVSIWQSCTVKIETHENTSLCVERTPYVISMSKGWIWWGGGFLC